MKALQATLVALAKLNEPLFVRLCGLTLQEGQCPEVLYGERVKIVDSPSKKVTLVYLPVEGKVTAEKLAPILISLLKVNIHRSFTGLNRRFLTELEDVYDEDMHVLEKERVQAYILQHLRRNKRYPNDSETIEHLEQEVSDRFMKQPLFKAYRLEETIDDEDVEFETFLEELLSIFPK